MPIKKRMIKNHIIINKTKHLHAKQISWNRALSERMEMFHSMHNSVHETLSSYSFQQYIALHKASPLCSNITTRAVIILKSQLHLSIKCLALDAVLPITCMNETNTAA